MDLAFSFAGDRDISAVYGPESEAKSAIMKDLGLKETKWKDNGVEYTLLQYIRPIGDAKTTGHLRSVIHRDGNIVCIAPPRAKTMEVFSEDHDPLKCMAEEVVEGTMINLFYDEGEWRLATRGTVGARSRFYRGVPSFRNMFLEAAGLVGLDFDRLPKDCCYSFMVQHPKNRIVRFIDNPAIYLVDRYQIDSSSRTATRIPYSSAIGALLADTMVRFPDRWPLSDYSSATEAFASSNAHHTEPGVMFRYDDSSIRAKVKNPNYEAVRRLRGNHPKEQYRYLALRQSNQLDNYLRYYPEDREGFDAFENHITAFIKELHSCYIQARPMRGGDDVVPKHLLPHVRALHKLYHSELRNLGQRVHHGIVSKYVSELPPARLMFAANYPLREEAKKVSETPSVVVVPHTTEVEVDQDNTQ